MVHLRLQLSLYLQLVVYISNGPRITRTIKPSAFFRKSFSFDTGSLNSQLKWWSENRCLKNPAELGGSLLERNHKLVLRKPHYDCNCYCLLLLLDNESDDNELLLLTVQICCTWPRKILFSVFPWKRSSKRALQNLTMKIFRFEPGGETLCNFYEWTFPAMKNAGRRQIPFRIKIDVDSTTVARQQNSFLSCFLTSSFGFLILIKIHIRYKS